MEICIIYKSCAVISNVFRFVLTMNFEFIYRSLYYLFILTCNIDFNCFFFSSGIEKEYEQKVLPDGKFNIDGFLCVCDVSQVPNRSIDKMVEMTAAILANCAKTKRPVVLVTTKNDEANEVCYQWKLMKYHPLVVQFQMQRD